jgi:hypothetical protein
MNVSKPIFRGQAKPIGGEQNKFLGEEMPWRWWDWDRSMVTVEWNILLVHPWGKDRVGIIQVSLLVQ